MKDFHIEKIIGVDSEDELDHDSSEQSAGRFTLRLYKEKQQSTSSVYLVIESKQDLVSILMARYFIRNRLLWFLWFLDLVVLLFFRMRGGII